MHRAARWTLGLLALVAAPAVASSCASGTSGDDGPANQGGDGGQGEGGSTGGEGASMPDGGTAGSGGEDPGPCMDNDDCPPDEVCDDGACVPGCLNNGDCPSGLTCCSGLCVDVATDEQNCGMCGNVCQGAPNQPPVCNGICGLGLCDDGYIDCDGDSSNGCEDTECSCNPGEIQECYSGPPGTKDVGECHAGTRQCNMAGTAWGFCQNEQIPTLEICGNGLDEDCNMVPDDAQDLDGDGWSPCEGDCCDQAGPECADPPLVNPGAFEVPGNMVDDDCDPSTSDAAPPSCSSTVKFTGVTGTDLAMAMDICNFTTLGGSEWGLISAELVNADGSAPGAAQLADLSNFQAAVLADYGTGGIGPQYGNTMAGISTGRMRDQGDPDYVPLNEGTEFGHVSTPPAAYLAQHGGDLPSSLGCNGQCLSGSGANDSINLRMQIRTPTNALSLSYRFKFATAEYWTYTCTPFNDFFLALLDSGHASIPPDHNISFDASLNPVSVNNSFFQICEPKGCHMCPLGTAQLVGTGLDELDGNGANAGMTGGATEWLVTTSPVLPGEIITLELMLFDVTDDRFDSITLLDDFQFDLSSSGVGTNPG